MNKTRIAVLFGSRSSEHEVSCVSAASVMRALDPDKYEIKKIGITKADGKWFLCNCSEDAVQRGDWLMGAVPFDPFELPETADFVLPILHGPNGEDGTVQGLLELLNIPYGGCGVLGAACVMDKIVAKKIFEQEGLPQTPYVAYTKRDLADTDAVIDAIDSKLRYPVFIKPANMGSSVGISRVKSRSGLRAAIEEAAKFDERFVAEQGVNARELETGIIGNPDCESNAMQQLEARLPECVEDGLFAAAVGEIVPGADFYDYEAKYTDAASELRIPAPISEEKKKELKTLARRAYIASGCTGYARVDFLMDKDTEELYINEINAIPGFTSLSMFPTLCAEAGLPYSDTIDKIVELGYERHNAENNR